MRRFFLMILLLFAVHPLWSAVYVVCAGISDYKSINDLTLPEKDAQAIADIYRTHTNNVTLLLGKDATKSEILSALRSQFSKAKRGDTIVFSFSGHGSTNCFCPYDATSQGGNLIYYSEIQSIMKSSLASHKIIFSDSCKSGGLRQNPKTNKGSSYNSKSDVLLFLSSRAGEYSIENQRMTNGYFTAYLAKGLRGKADANLDRMITAKELFDYVSSHVQTATQNKQHPVMWGRFDNDFVIMNWTLREKQPLVNGT